MKNEKMLIDSKNDIYNDVVINDYGFYMLRTVPDDKAREEYYKTKYYQEAKGSYEVVYSKDELAYIHNKLEQKLLLIKTHWGGEYTDYSLLDIGCGEGFALSFFKKLGFHIQGIDYSKYGVEKHNPDVLDSVFFGDMYDIINSLIIDSKKYNIINLDNVLEHVIDPSRLLQQVFDLLEIGGIVIIKVPNDFSYLQNLLWEKGVITKAHWVVPLDHISYFNRTGLINICKSGGLRCVDFLGQQMIEFFALNENTNYFEKKEVGKSCHLARIEQENIFHSISPSKYLALSRILGEMEIGREIIGVFSR